MDSENEVVLSDQLHSALSADSYETCGFKNALEIESAEPEVDDDGKAKRKGNVWTASAHIITAVIGSGVLSLSWSIAQMGWIAGPTLIILFALCTLYTSRLLADCYRSPNPITGRRNYIYIDAVRVNLSRRAFIICGFVQYTNLIGVAIGYTITSASSIRAIQKTNCLHRHRDSDDKCLSSTTLYIIGFGAVQIILSQIPSIANLWCLSYFAAAMSFTYSLILLALGIGKTVQSNAGHDYGSIGGVSVGIPHGIAAGHVSESVKVWKICIALGDIAFAYSYSVILLEIADTLRSWPPENEQMKVATGYGISMTTFFYLTVGVLGYSAFGNSVDGNLLTSFTSPSWLVDFANACVAGHLVGAYQVFTQPVFQVVEMWIGNRYPESMFLTKGYNLRIPVTRGKFRILHLNPFRVGWRLSYVVFTTVIAMLLPFFNDVLGILGAFGFLPLTVYFPVAMYVQQFQVPRWSKLWMAVQLLSLIALLVSMAALIGSIVGIYLDVKDGIKLFKKD